MKFYTSDLHFFHKNIITFENRPFYNVNNMNDTLIKNWNNKVGNSDEVYILGDFAFTDGKGANSLLSNLNGRKYLIIGNHDSFLRDKEFDKSHFVFIRDYARIMDNGKKLILFHYPITVWDCQHHGSIHLYGHIHKGGHERHPLVNRLQNAYNVGTDCWNFEPVTLEEILKRS